MAMTLRLDPRLEAELRLAAEEDRRSVHQTVVLAVETASAAAEFITGPLLEDPRRVGKPLGAELAGIYSARLGRDWRVLYEIDDARHAVIVLDIRHRSTSYRHG